MSHKQLIADELQTLLQTTELDAQIRQKLDELRARLLELEVEHQQLQAENRILKNDVPELAIQASDLDDLSKRVLCWLAKRGSESCTAIAFGVCVDNTRAHATLSDLSKRQYVMRIEEEFEKWRITEAGTLVAQSLGTRQRSKQS